MNVSLSGAGSNPYLGSAALQNAGGARPTRGAAKADNDGDADDKAASVAANSNAPSEGGSGLNVLA